MFRYPYLYSQFVKMSFARDMQYRTGFWMSMSARLIWVGVFLFIYKILYANVLVIKGWTYPQALLLLSIFFLLETLLFVFFIGNLSRLSQYISRGELDVLLTKPVDVQFHVSLRYTSFTSVLNLIPPMILMIYAISLSSTEMSLWQWPVLFASIGLGVIILYSLWLIIMTLLFWLVGIPEFQELFLTIFRLMQFPPQIYGGVLKFILLYILPLTLTVMLPVQSILAWSTIGTPFLINIALAAVFFVISRMFWQYGLRHYGSASS